MTHSTVLIIGEPIEDLLDPYDENKEVEPYWVVEYQTPGDYYHTEKWVESGLLPPNPSMDQLYEVLTSNQESDEEAEDLRLQDGAIERRSTYNPDSKWDWWAVGGRWRGMLILKPDAAGHLEPPHWGETIGGNEPKKLPANAADQARKKDIDIEAMRAKSVEDATKRWAKYDQVRKDHPLLPIWAAFRDGYATIEEARKAYHEDPGIHALKEAELIGFMSSWEEEFMPYTRSEYLEQARLFAVPGFATLTEKGWIEPGRMGWWGITMDQTKDSTQNYLVAANQLIDSADDEDLFTIVDVHI